MILESYRSHPNTVVGDLRVWRDVYSPQLDNTRDILVWLPPDYETSTRRYPVFYMHDAQNLFDANTGYAGEWQVDETMTMLAREGLAALVVALPNMREQRTTEYSPYRVEMGDWRAEGTGDAYVRFLVDTVKPAVDRALRTRSEADSTGVAGSSMGGLISLYAAVTHPEIFGLCGAFSVAYWFGEHALAAQIRASERYPGRVYLDVGTREGETLGRWSGLSGTEADAAYVRGVRELRDTLTATGCGALMYVEDEGAAHRESAWAARFPEAMRFLLATNAEVAP